MDNDEQRDYAEEAYNARLLQDNGDNVRPPKTMLVVEAPSTAKITVVEDPAITELHDKLTRYSTEDDALAEWYDVHQGRDPDDLNMLWSRDDAGVDVANCLRGLIESGYLILKVVTV